MTSFVSNGPLGNLLFTPVAGQLIWRIRTDDILRKGLSSAFRPGFPIPEKFVDDVRGMTYHSLTATSNASDDYLAQSTMPARLAPLHKPVLVLYGSEDGRWQPGSFSQYRAVPGARIQVIPRVGHSPMVELPATTLSRLRAFLGSVGTTP